MADPWNAFPRVDGGAGNADAITRNLVGADPWAAFPVVETAAPAKGQGGGWTDTALDMARSAGSGVAAGVAGVVGFPHTLNAGMDFLARLPGQALGYQFNEDPSRQPRTFVPQMPTTAQARSVINNIPGADYKPQTMPGKFAHTVAEFAPGALVGGVRSVADAGRNLVNFALVPGLASETAGQATQGSSWEPYARGAAALASGGAAAMVNRPGSAQAILERGARGVTPQQQSAAEALFFEAQQVGTPITWAEAIQHASNGATRLGDVQRVVEGNGGMRDFFANRVPTNDAAARRTFDDLGSSHAIPSNIGAEAQQAARAAYADTPAGQALAQRQWEAGPRVTPEQAGQVIQPSLRNVYERREGMRNALADQDYGAARNAPATVPLDGGFGFRDVAKHYEPPAAYPVTRDANGRMRRMSADEIAAAELRAPLPVNPIVRGPDGRMRRMSEEEVAAETARRAQALDEARTARQSDLNVTERMPVVGLPPTQFGQIDARGVVAHLDDALQTAKGTAAEGLRAARKAMETPEGAIDTTVAGLHNARSAITDMISQASQQGAKNAARELEGALKTLDNALERVPAYGAARQNFEAASKPLAPFGENRVPGQVVQRDQYGREFVMPAENVPGAIQQGGASAARDFNAVASGPARQSYEGYLTTQFLDQATKAGADVSAKSIRKALLQNEDMLRQFPEVRARLENIANARDVLDRAMVGPLGALAKRKDPTTQAAIEALFPTNPLPGSAQEVGSAVAALASKSPTVARQLVRAHVESVFNEAAQNLQSGMNQFGGASFAATLRGNRQQAENLQAAVKALPAGDKTWTGLDKMLNVFEAQGTRQRIGSQTSFNNEINAALKRGGAVEAAGKVGVGGMLQWPRKALETVENWRMGRNVDRLAEMLTDPKTAVIFRELAASGGGRKGDAIAMRLAMIGSQPLRSPREPGQRP